MKVVAALRALGPIDVHSVRRDALLRWMALLPIGFGLLMRWFVPFVAAQVKAQFAFDITPYYPVVSGLMLLMVPMIFGMVVGFLLLDQKDDATLVALQVTPLTLRGYLAYRIALPVLLSVLLTLAVYPIAGLVAVHPLHLLLGAVAAAPLAPLFALFLAAIASNKVQGLALQKTMGVIILPPLVAYFIRSPWQLALGIAPTYWPVRTLWALQAGGAQAWLYLAVGLAYQAALLALLMRRFERTMSR